MIGNYHIDVIENPLVVLDEAEKRNLMCIACSIISNSTGKPTHDLELVWKYLFGIKNRGRVLITFTDASSTRCVGFISLHLYNRAGKLLRWNNATIMHLGSAHLLKEEQGNMLVYRGAMWYIKQLPEDTRPIYAAGFTQSPKVLKLLTLASNSNVVPTLNQDDNTHILERLRTAVLPEITADMGNVSIRDSCIVQGIGEPVYSEKILTGDCYDAFFYKTLGIKTEDGEFLYFLLQIPQY